MDHPSLHWQSKLALLLVLPFTAAAVIFEARDWAANAPAVAAGALILSAALGVLAWATRSGTPAAAFTGALITAALIFSTASVPFHAWETALVPVLALMVLTSLSTRFGRARKQRLGAAEKTHGRGAAQVAANLGLAALVSTPAAQMWIANTFPARFTAAVPFSVLALAALAEAAADTVSSEIGQVLGGRPVMLTTLRRVDPGTDGAISLAGTAAGILAAGIVAAAGALAVHGSGRMCVLAWSGGVFGLFFDSLLGATIERKGWLNNDAVNFLSTASATAFTMSLFPRL